MSTRKERERLRIELALKDLYELSPGEACRIDPFTNDDVWAFVQTRIARAIAYLTDRKEELK